MAHLNITNGKEIALFVDYPQYLLDGALFCCVLFIMLGVPGNLITIIALVKSKKVHNATGVFIINLTVSDLMFGMFNLPLATSLFFHRAWVHTRFLCLLFPILRYGLVAVSVFTVLAITINRYIMIAHQTLYRKLYTKTYLILMLIATWIGAFGALVPTLLEVWGTFGLDPSIGSCTILPDADGNSPKAFLFIFAFLLPCLAICVCYARIFCIVHRAHKKSHSSNLESSNYAHSNRNSKNVSPSAYSNLTFQSHSPSEVDIPIQTSCCRNSNTMEILEQNGKDYGQELEIVDLEPKYSVEKYSNSGPNNDTSSKTAPNVDQEGLVFFKTPYPDYSITMTSSISSADGITSPSLLHSETSPSSNPTTPLAHISAPKFPEIRQASKRSNDKGGKTTFLRGTMRRKRTGSLISKQPTLSSQDRRLLKMILVIFISFVACYLPITLVKIFGKDDNPILNILGLLLIYMTTCINPIIYVVMSSEYRQAYVSLLTCRRDSDSINRSSS